MKLVPVTKLDKRNKTTSKKKNDDDVMSCQKTVTSFLFFQLTASLEQSGSRIPDA